MRDHQAVLDRSSDWNRCEHADSAGTSTGDHAATPGHREKMLSKRGQKRLFSLRPGVYADPTLTPAAAARALITNIAHANEHYSNLVTYLRLNKLVPPSTERRTRAAK